MKLVILLADVCLSDYWSGHHLAHICIPVYKGMLGKDIRSALHSEVLQGAIAGSVDYQITESEEWYNAAKDAINELELLKGEDGLYFEDLEESDEDYSESVYAYFVFEVIEE